MDFHRLFDILQYQQAKYPQKVALAGKRDGQWRTFSTEECLQNVAQLGAGLHHLGLKKGDTAAILAHCGSPEWNFADLALQQIGAVVVPIHATTLPTDVAYILDDAGACCCFVSNRAMLEKVQSVKASLPALQHVFSFEKMEGVPHWEDLLLAQSSIVHLNSSIREDDLATILYTSGTTGQPKGVMLSHANVVSNIKAVMTLVPINYRMDALSFLPLSHIFERMVTYLYMAAGASVWYSESVEELSEDLRQVRPHFFTAVPRVLEKMHERILEARSRQKGFRKKLLDWSLHWGEEYDPLEKLSPLFWLRHWLADFFVYRKWRQSLGGRVGGVVVGAAAMPPRLSRLFNAAGIRVREGYGLTETSPVISFNHFEPGLYQFGTVGIPIPGVEVKIEEPDEAGDGEILVRGPNVMLGYFQKPTAPLTRSPAHLSHLSEGWFRTGDAGRFVNRRFLQITGRKRDFFKTNTGKYVAPQKVENQLNTSPFIEQSLAVGLNRPCVAALMVPNFMLLEKWCAENGVHWTAPQFMALNPKVLKMMNTVVEDLNRQLEPHEQVRRFTLLHEEWTAATGDLTVTMKVMRAKLAAKFEREIREMYEK